MSTDNKKPGSELDNIIDKLGLEELENNNIAPEDFEDGESLIDLDIVEDELKNNEFKSVKKWKKLNISIVAGGILIVVLIITILILKSCSSGGPGGNQTTDISGFYNGQGTTAGDIDRPENITSAIVTTDSEEEETPLDPSIR